MSGRGFPQVGPDLAVWARQLTAFLGRNIGLKFKITGETINGLDSQDSVACNFIKSQAYAPHHHIDDSTEAWVPRRAAGTTAFTYIDYESAVTEQNRNLKVIKPQHISTVAQQFSAAMANG